MGMLLLASASEDAAALYNERVAIVLGFLTLFTLLAVFLSCRSCLALFERLKLAKLAGSRAYRRFYQYHSYYWWVFGALLLAHFMIAFFHTGLPQAGDPDAPVHWAILLLGLGAALSCGTLFLSCRIMPRLITMATSKKPLGNVTFRAFFGLHASFWWLILLLAAAHFAVSYLHAGVWPQA